MWTIVREGGALPTPLSRSAAQVFHLLIPSRPPSPGALPHARTAAPRSTAARTRCPGRPERGRAAPIVVAVAAVAVAVAAAAQAAGAARPPAGLRGRAAFPSHRGPLLSAPRDAGPLCRLSSAPARGGEQPLAGRQPPPSPWLAAPPSGILLPPLLRVVAQSNLRQRRGSMSGTKYVDSEVGRPGGRSRAAAGARPALRGAEGRDGERGYGERDGTGRDVTGRDGGRAGGRGRLGRFEPGRGCGARPRGEGGKPKAGRAGRGAGGPSAPAPAKDAEESRLSGRAVGTAGGSAPCPDRARWGRAGRGGDAWRRPWERA